MELEATHQRSPSKIGPSTLPAVPGRSEASTYMCLGP